MPRYGSADVLLLMSGLNITGTRTNLDMEREALTEETTGLGMGWQEHDFVGVRRWSMTQQGFFDDAAGSSHEALQGLSRQIMTLTKEGDAIGKPFEGAGGMVQTHYRLAMQVGELHKANADYQGDGAIEDGVVLHPLSTETADGDTESAPHDNGASSPDGGAIYLHVTSLDLDGHDDVSIAVLESADDITYVELEAFADVSALGAQRVAVAGTIQRYTAVEWSFNGSGTSPSIGFWAGIARF